MRIVFGIIILIFTVLSCRDTSTEFMDGTPKGSFSYKAYNKSGQIIVQGWLTLEFNNSEIKGSWKLEETFKGSARGPHVGTGALRGSRDADDVIISLNLNMVDNNITLIGKIKGDLIEGIWRYDGFAGNLDSGNFSAEKNK